MISDIQTRRALLYAILESPEDDAARLVYADWLDDHGYTNRAEFIRLQITSGEQVGICGDCYIEPCEGPTAELIRPNQKLWTGPFPLDRSGPVRCEWFWRRGFIDELCYPADLWYVHGPGICVMHPVRRLWLLDREPQFGDSHDVSRWYRMNDHPMDEERLSRMRLNSHWFPSDWRKFMRPTTDRSYLFNEASEAKSALNWAALNWARSLNGLSPLPFPSGE